MEKLGLPTPSYICGLLFNCSLPFFKANASLPKEIEAGLLEHVLTTAQPIFQAADDGEFILWMERRLPGLIRALNGTLVPLLFGHLESRNCSAPKAV